MEYRKLTPTERAVLGILDDSWCTLYDIMRLLKPYGLSLRKLESKVIRPLVEAGRLEELHEQGSLVKWKKIPLPLSTKVTLSTGVYHFNESWEGIAGLKKLERILRKSKIPYEVEHLGSQGS